VRHRRDFHAFEAEAGEVVQFHGQSCAHFTVPNDTVPPSPSSA
jgi:hypothetical protein